MGPFEFRFLSFQDSFSKLIEGSVGQDKLSFGWTRAGLGSTYPGVASFEN